MRPTILISSLILFFSIGAFAQSPNNVRAVKASKQMDKTVALSEDQFTKVNEAYLNMYRKLEDIQSDSEPEKSKASYEIKADFNNSLTKILNDRQLTKWYEHNGDESTPIKYVNPKNKLSPEEKAQASAKRKAERLSKELNLTEDQKKKVYEAHLAQHSEASALREKAKENPTAVRKERIRLKNELDDTIEQILTEDQKSKKKELRENQIKKQTRIKDKQKVSQVYTKADKITRRAETQTNHMATRLKMSEDQKTAFRSASIEKFRALDNMKETAKNKTTQEKNALRLEIHENFRTKAAKFLSPEQMEKLKARAE
ncbi:MAG: hypothetical protein AB8F74_13430 [Saprospiraceae bacterium]